MQLGQEESDRQMSEVVKGQGTVEAHDRQNQDARQQGAADMGQVTQMLLE
jgi:hypothetical protein